MIVRIRWKEGTDRIEIDENQSLLALKQKISEKLQLKQFTLTKEGGTPLSSDSSTLKSLSFKNGELLLLQTNQITETKQSNNETENNAIVIEEDEIDKYLSQQDGWVKRERDSRMCHHGANARCVHCMPIAPWTILEHDPWKSEKLKFIPFHAYVRKMQQNTAQANKSESKPLEQPSYRVRPCSKHPPWPEGICTDCDPGAIRIIAQPYRHIDHVEFETMEMVDKFIQAWRERGHQRSGFLYGKYVPNEHVPLGITAQIAAIYEPPQNTGPNESVLLNDPLEEHVDRVAAQLGLQRIGFIWTDLHTDPKTRKPMKNRGDIKLSSAEIIRMAKMQNKTPSPCKQSTNGYLGSKFVSVVISGNEFGEVEVEAFQVSDQCMSLVKDGIITVSKHADKVRVKKSTTQYIPEVNYNAINEYKLEVLKKAEPTVPSEFFIIPLPHGAPKSPKPVFKSTSFPIENRGINVTIATLRQQLEKAFGTVGDALSDFHLLLYLTTQIPPEQIPLIVGAVLGKQEVEGKVKTIIETLVQSAAASTATATASSSTGQQQSTTTSASSGRPKHAQEDQLIAQIAALGFSADQAREALWATNYQGVDAAVDFLFNQ